jgi:porin
LISARASVALSQDEWLNALSDQITPLRFKMVTPASRFGAGFIYTQFSDSVSGFDQDKIAYTGVPGSARDREISVEFTYVAQVISGWSVQPDVQYISHPNGQAGRDAKVEGIRSTWNY